MPGKWNFYELNINGLLQKVRYREATVEQLFLPFLQQLAVLQGEKKRRILVFLAAPPAVGKSTLALFLEQLSKGREMPSVQAIGLDGFHFHAEEIEQKSVCRNGKLIPMQAVKGCAESFDTEKLQAKLQELCQGKMVLWPLYDRRIHDVREDAVEVTGNIILLEGNWLLLQESRWQAIRKYADVTLLIRAKSEQLKERLIQRKVQGGKTLAEAMAFYEQSDRFNVEKVLKDSGSADWEWQLVDADDYILFQNS